MIKHSAILLFTIFFILTTTTACTLTETTIPESELYEAKISGVTDGDTIRIIFDYEIPDGCKKEETVRLIGVNTPELFTEPPEFYSQEAYNYTHKYLLEEVQIELDKVTGLRDKYGRLLAYVWLCNYSLLNKNLIEDGLGYYYGYFKFNSKYMEEFISAQNIAKSKQEGLWQ